MDFTAISATAAAVVLMSIPASAQSYSVTDIGTLGGSASQAFGINDIGQVTGWSQDSNGAQVPFVWQEGVMSALPAGPNATSSIGLAINNSGTVVGYVQIGPVSRGALWTPDGVTVLPTLGCNCEESVVAHAVNDLGQIALLSARAHVGESAFVWQDGSIVLLGSGHTGDTTTALGIDNNGDVVGAVSGSPVVWWGGDPNNRTDMGHLTDGFGGTARAMNVYGQAVGFAVEDVHVTGNHAFFWDPTYGMSDLGTLGGTNSDALAISGFLVVGQSGTWTGRIHAFLYDVQGPGFPVDLNDLIPPDSGWELTSATGINASGQIVGFGIVGGETHAFLLTPASD